MQKDAMLIQLGYTPNEALVAQIQKIQKNTLNYEKIEKHIMDLHDHLKVDGSFVAMSNSKDYFKIKIEAQSDALAEEAHEKAQRFAEKFKISLEKENDHTYYIIGFQS